MNNFHLRLFASALLLPLFGLACHPEPSSVSKLVSQLNGHGCDFDVVYDSVNNKDECKLSALGFGEWIATSTAELECSCRGKAARCLALLGDESKEAIPELVKYLSNGPTDVDNGDGGSSCLSDVLTTLGEIGRGEEVINPLIDYLKHPRRIYQLSPGGSGSFSGLKPAIVALVKLHPAGETATQTLRELTGRSDPEWQSLRPLLIQSLQRLGDEESISEAIKELDKFELFLNAPVTRELNMLTVQVSGFKSVAVSLESLKEWALKLPLASEERENRPIFKKLLPAKPRLETMLSKFDSAVPKWINNNIIVPQVQQLYVHNAPRPMEFERIRINIVILLARIGEQSILSKLLEVIEDIPPDGKPVELLLSFGNKLDELVPQIITLAEDLQFQNKPLSETVDGSKFRRASILIETLLRHSSPAANAGIERLEQNKHLQRSIRRLKKRLGAK